jgi:hypothetical protein
MQRWAQEQDPVSLIGAKVRAVKKIEQHPRSKEPDVPRGAVGWIEDWTGRNDYAPWFVDFGKKYGVLQVYVDEITLI